jgi:hypothetical protein
MRILATQQILDSIDAAVYFTDSDFSSCARAPFPPDTMIPKKRKFFVNERSITRHLCKRREQGSS